MMGWKWTLDKLSAGPFSAWLRDARNALKTGTGTDVPCGTCTACCMSSYFIHIKPEETDTLARIGKDAVTQASGLPKGHMLMGHDAEGICPQMNQGQCAVYAHRPQTCRAYDCRVFAAAGIREVESKARINERVEQWRFDYPTPRDREEHEAVKAAAKFISENAGLFPGGRIPSTPSQLAILALKVHEIFMEVSESASDTARRIVEVSRTA
jgi:Fe-S-cluster containining protein